MSDEDFRTMLRRGQFGRISPNSYVSPSSRMFEPGYMSAGLCLFMRNKNELFMLMALEHRQDQGLKLSFPGGKREQSGESVSIERARSFSLLAF